MIFLKNKGEIEIECISAMGVNVKENDSPIGFFGTGLKYAIAVFLREGVKFSLHIGENLYTFHTEEKIIRGKSFNFCKMQSEFDVLDLALTTEHGKNWDIWQAYREIHSNTLDEGGTISTEKRNPEAGSTLFQIDIDESFQKVFLSNQNKKIVHSDNCVEIYEGQSDYIFYKGIRAMDLHKPSLYTYNILTYCELTEDRSLSYNFQVERAITNAVSAAKCKKLIGNIVTADGSYYESSIDASWDTKEPQEAFKEVVKENISSVSENFHGFFKKHEPKPKPELTKDEKKELFINQIKDICKENNMVVLCEEGFLNIKGWLFN